MLQKGDAGWLQYLLLESILQGCIFCFLIFVLGQNQHFPPRNRQSCFGVCWRLAVKNPPKQQDTSGCCLNGRSIIEMSGSKEWAGVFQVSEALCFWGRGMWDLKERIIDSCLGPDEVDLLPNRNLLKWSSRGPSPKVSPVSAWELRVGHLLSKVLDINRGICDGSLECEDLGPLLGPSSKTKSGKNCFNTTVEDSC